MDIVVVGAGISGAATTYELAMAGVRVTLIERAGPDGPVLAMGCSGHGFCLGPVTGRICASLARGEMPNLPIEPFKLGRFGAVPASADALTLHG